MREQLDRIRVWNEETGEMIEPVTIQEMIRNTHNLALIHGEHIQQESDPYGHLVFMRNTGIYSELRFGDVNQTGREVFDGDLITRSIEPWIYRVKYAPTHGCWWAESLCRDAVLGRQLSKIFHPAIVGNIFEDKELVRKGEVIDE
jgi:hypothetical protein